MVLLLHPTNWPETSDTLRKVLIIDEGPTLRCHGMNKGGRGPRCKNRVSMESSASIVDLLRQIASKGSFFAAKSLLDQVAHLVVCKNVHQCQSTLFLQRWEKTLLQLKANPTTDEAGGSSDATHEGENFMNKLAALKTSPNTIGHNTSSVRTRKTIKKENGSSHDVKLEAANETNFSIEASLPSRTSKQPARRQCESDRSAKKTPEHVFERFSTPRSTFQLNLEIKKAVQRRLSLNEFPTNPEGYIYLYTFPGNYRDASPHIKIGFTNNLNVRMASWARQCGYKPRLLSYFSAELYVKVEKLVHAQLSNQRRRERPCPGCSVRHHEWFEVKNSKAAGIVGLWTDWSRREPYDKRGFLKKEWQDRLDDADLSDPNCWESFVNDDSEDDDSEYGSDDYEEEDSDDFGDFDDDDDVDDV